MGGGSAGPASSDDVGSDGGFWDGGGGGRELVAGTASGARISGIRRPLTTGHMPQTCGANDIPIRLSHVTSPNFGCGSSPA